MNRTGVFQPADGRQRDARGLADQGNWVLHDDAHVLWYVHLTDDTRRHWGGSGVQRLRLASQLYHTDWILKRLFPPTVNADVVFAVRLAGGVDCDARVASRVGHLGVFDLQQPPLVQDLGPLLAADGTPVLQPRDGRSGDALGGALEADVAPFGHDDVGVALALAVFDGRTDWSERSK